MDPASAQSLDPGCRNLARGCEAVSDAAELSDGYSTVLAEAEADRSASAMAIADAVYAAVGLRHRFQEAIGVAVALETAACLPGEEPIVGVVSDAGSDAVAISGSRSLWVVPLASVEVVRGLPLGHRHPIGAVAQRRSMAALLRALTGSDLTIALRKGRLVGRLERIGVDHVQFRVASGNAVVPFPAIGWVRTSASLRASPPIADWR